MSEKPFTKHFEHSTEEVLNRILDKFEARKESFEKDAKGLDDMLLDKIMCQERARGVEGCIEYVEWCLRALSLKRKREEERSLHE